MTTRFPYSPVKVPPIPALIVTLARPDGSGPITDLPAHLDTAADATVVPLGLIHRLGIPPVGPIVVVGFGGTKITVELFDVRVEIPGVAIVGCRVFAHPDEPVILIGRDILNNFRFTLDGPNQVVEFH